MPRKPVSGAVKYLPEPWAHTAEPLFWLGGCGHELRQSHREYFFDARRRGDQPHVVLQFTLSGCGWYERAGRAVRLEPGMAFLDVIPGPFRYGCRPDSREPYELVFISMRGRPAYQWQQRLARSFGHVLHLGPRHPVAEQMLALVRLRERERLEDRYQVSARLYRLTMDLFSALTRSRAATVPFLAAALESIEVRAREPQFNVEELARALNCSREHLARVFRSGLNTTPLERLTRHRLDLVLRELRGARDKLDGVAARCGFSGANYLCRVFRKRFGITPAQARARPWMLG